MSGDFRGAALLLLAMALLWVAVPAEAGSGGPGRKGPDPQVFPAGLDLSAEQKEKMEEIQAQGRTEGRSVRKAILRLCHELEGEMLADEPDAGRLRELVTQIGELKIKQKIRRLETRLAVRKLLTPEQRDRLLLLEQHRRHASRDQRGGKPPQLPGPPPPRARRGPGR